MPNILHIFIRYIFLNPIYKVLEEGNQSMKWINQYEQGLSIEQIMKISIEDMIRSEGEKV